MSLTQAIKPDVLDSTGGVVQTSHPLDPCPNCGSRPQESPVGVNPKGEAHWNFLHCWKCGFRPGATVGFSVDALKHQWDAFQAWIGEHQPSGAERGMAPPSDPNEIAAMREQMASMAADLAQFRQEAARATEPATGDPMAGGQ